MPEKKPKGGKRPGAGRKPGREYPCRVNVRVNHEQFSHLEQCAGREEMTIADYVRRLIDLDVGVVPGKVIITLNPSTAQAIRAERPAGDEEGQELAY